MNTLLADNSDLEIWEGWVGDTHSVAATWYRTDKKARCGYQLFSTWRGEFTLMLLIDDKWTTPINKSKEPFKVRQEILKYMSERIAKLSESKKYTDKVEASFNQAHSQVNDWLNEQMKLVDWFDKYK